MYNSAKARWHGNRVLLVDDEPDITFSFNMILDDIGFVVDTFNDPQEALTNFKSGIYDIAILDIRMPKMNGFELSRKIRKTDDKIKIVYMTAYDIHSDLNNGNTKSILAKEKPVILRKPISLSELVFNVKKELEY